MARILLTTSAPSDPVLRQLPRRSAGWCTHDFVVALDDGPFDSWVVYDNLDSIKTANVQRRDTLLITGEPPSVRRYRARFTSQFGSVRTSHSSIQHACIERSHEAQIWHYGMHACRSHPQVLDYDMLAAFTPPPKPKLLSVISSNKSVTPDHRQRLVFVERLRQAFGDCIDVFGRGIRELEDKADAIWDYRYHIVLENDHSDCYMSEKLPDAFLGWSYPFYSGSKFADKIFPSSSFSRIDMYRPEESIASIQRHIQADSYTSNLDRIGNARAKVLDETNLFAVICKRMVSREFQSGTQPNVKNPRVSRRTTLFPKRKSVRLMFQRMLRTIHLAA